MLKKIYMMAIIALVCAWSVGAVQVGDVLSQDIEEIFSETDRITSQNVEFLYTFRGVRARKEVVESVNDNNFTAKFQYGEVETEFVIEKAIPLTGNYHILISVDDLLCLFGNTSSHPSSGYLYWTWDDGTSWGVQGKFETNFLYRATSNIVIGDSCFEDNELVESIYIESGYEQRKLKIGRRAFYGAKKLNSVTVSSGFPSAFEVAHDYNGEFENLQLKSIGESAFEGCQKLAVLGCACDELESIGSYAFKDCTIFGGIMTDKESVDNVVFADVKYGAEESYVSFWSDEAYNCFTPKLVRIGQYAFYNAGSDIEYFDRFEISGTLAVYPELFKWTQGNDIVIEENAFVQCGFLREIHFPEGIRKIAVKSFERLNAIKEGMSQRPPTRLHFPDSLVVVEDSAFAYSNVQVMKWPESLREIEHAAFYGLAVPIDYSINSEKTSVIETLRYESFCGMPLGLEKLGDSAFGGSYRFGAWASPVKNNGKITSLDYSSSTLGVCGPLGGTLIYPAKLTYVPRSCFAYNAMIEEIVLHNFVTNIGDWAFEGCSKLKIVVPPSVSEVGIGAASSHSVMISDGIYTIPGVKSVIFEGKPPKGIVQSGFLGCSQVLVSEEYAADWAPYMSGNMKIAKKINGQWVALGGKAVSNAMRTSDPTIMDIKYTVTSTKDKVDVRLLAFQDGNRSFAKVLRPETFVEGTEANVGNGVAANVEHTVSWQVSKDWNADLAKLSVEVFVMEDNLLPLQLTTIPAMGDKAAVTFSRNEQSSEKIMNALYWLYADKTSDLTLENGVLKSGGKQLVNGTTLYTENAISYIYSKMGYGLLSGDTLKYVNDLMRSSISSGKFAVKEGASE